MVLSLYDNEQTGADGVYSDVFHRFVLFTVIALQLPRPTMPPEERGWPTNFEEA